MIFKVEFNENNSAQFCLSDPPSCHSLRRAPNQAEEGDLELL